MKNITLLAVFVGVLTYAGYDIYASYCCVPPPPPECQTKLCPPPGE